MSQNSLSDLIKTIEDDLKSFTEGQGHSKTAHDVVYNVNSNNWDSYRYKILKAFDAYKKEVSKAAQEIDTIDSQIKSNAPKFGDYLILEEK